MYSPRPNPFAPFDRYMNVGFSKISFEQGLTNGRQLVLHLIDGYSIFWEARMSRRFCHWRYCTYVFLVLFLLIPPAWGADDSSLWNEALTKIDSGDLTQAAVDRY